MKKIMKLFVFVAAAAMTLASCQKNEVKPAAPQDVEYTFLLGSEDDVDSKATIGENNVVWELDDRVGTYTNSSKNKYSKIKSLNPVTLSVYSSGLTVGEKLYFYYPHKENNATEKTAVEMSIPVEQDGKDDMPMVSLPFSVTSASDANNTDYADIIRFANLGSVIEFGVYTDNDEYASETIESITFAAEQNIAGDFTFDLTQVDYSDKSTLDISGYESKSVMVSVGDAVVGTSENRLYAKMVVAPGSYTGNIIVQTNAAKYTFPITSAQVLERSQVKPLGLRLRADIREANPVAPADVWTLVTSVDNMQDGGYVILAKHVSASGYGYLPTTTTSSAPKYTAQTVFDAVTPVYTDVEVIDAMVWHFTASSGKWTIKNAEGKYFTCNKHKNTQEWLILTFISPKVTDS